VAGVVAALSFLAMPRMFYHAHLACFDMPVAAMWLTTAYAYHRSLHAPGYGWPIVTGVLYGLLLGTKHNAWLLPPALLLHLFITRGPELLAELRQRRIVVPRGLVAMALLGPPVFYASWPWIWHDTIPRLVEYVRFHTGHEYYNMEFLGTTYWKPPMPRGYAPVMTAVTVPSVTLGLFVGGLVVSGLSLRQRTSDSGRAAVSTHVLWALGLLVGYAPWLSDQTPIFGGTKHWITAYPFLCLFAGSGFQALASRASSVLPRVRSWLVQGALAASVLAAPVVMTLHAHPYGLSFYAPIVGGAPGAASLGLNRGFWGYTSDAVLPFVNERAAKSAVIYVHDTALQSYDMLRRDGRVRRDLKPTLAIHQSQLALYHHEAHMRRVEYQIWVDYGTASPSALGVYDGVPIVWLYERQRTTASAPAP
jgi:hypothetical protein